MKKVHGTTADEVGSSVNSIYQDLLDKRESDRALVIEEKRIRKEAEEAARLEAGEDEEKQEKLSKKEKAQEDFNAWQGVLIGLTGDDLEYVGNEKKKKKYKKWASTPVDGSVESYKPKKVKKKDFAKKFDPELKTLQNIVVDQNKFTQDLMRRFQNQAGPATKNAAPMNKTLVELASIIIHARSTSLGYINAITSTKKTVEDLYMKQRKEDRETGGGAAVEVPQDLGLIGSDIAKQIYAGMGINSMETPVDIQGGVVESPVVPQGDQISVQATAVAVPQSASDAGIPIAKFDPASWNPTGVDTTAAKYEATPHKVVVEYDKDNGTSRYMAIDTTTNQELPECPVPSGTVKKINFDTNAATDEFDTVYEVVMKE